MFGKNLTLPKFEDIRAARAYIGWSQTKFAKKVGLNLSSITKIETGQQHPTKEHLDTMAEVFLGEGVKFHEEGGFVIQSKDVVRIFDGVDGYLKVLEDVLQTHDKSKIDCLLLGADERRSSEKINKYKKKMYEAGVSFKLLVSNNNNYILGPIDDYKQVDKEFFLSKDVVLIYGDKVSFCLQIEGDIEKYDIKNRKHIVIKDADLAETFRTHFNRLWKKGDKIIKSSAKQIFFKVDEK